MAATPAYAFAAGMFLAAAALAQDTKTDADTGLVIDEGFALVKGQCTGCHSAK
jgi:mono/diheme cytochrome c family protein